MLILSRCSGVHPSIGYFRGVFSRVHTRGYPGTPPGCCAHTRVGTRVPPSIYPECIYPSQHSLEIYKGCVSPGIHNLGYPGYVSWLLCSYSGGYPATKACFGNRRNRVDTQEHLQSIYPYRLCIYSGLLGLPKLVVLVMLGWVPGYILQINLESVHDAAWGNMMSIRVMPHASGFAPADYCCGCSSYEAGERLFR